MAAHHGPPIWSGQAPKQGQASHQSTHDAHSMRNPANAHSPFAALDVTQKHRWLDQRIGDISEYAKNASVEHIPNLFQLAGLFEELRPGPSLRTLTGLPSHLNPREKNAWLKQRVKQLILLAARAPREQTPIFILLAKTYDALKMNTAERIASIHRGIQVSRADNLGAMHALNTVLHAHGKALITPEQYKAAHAEAVIELHGKPLVEQFWEPSAKEEKLIGQLQHHGLSYNLRDGLTSNRTHDEFNVASASQLRAIANRHGLYPETAFDHSGSNELQNEFEILHAMNNASAVLSAQGKHWISIVKDSASPNTWHVVDSLHADWYQVHQGSGYEAFLRERTHEAVLIFPA